MHQIANPFFSLVLAEVPRLLGQLNRNPASRAYGSFDRQYWHHRTNDISNARKQEAFYTLALLYAHPLPGNGYAGSPLLLSWINAALDYTLSIQHANGSWDEWYVNESSFITTSFVANAVAETLLLLPRASIPSYERTTLSLRQAGDRVAAEKEHLVFNQTAGSAVALFNIFLVTGDETYRRASEMKIDEVLAGQTEEGWWSEYGGPDVGYLSLMIEYLSRYASKHDYPGLSAAIEKAEQFLLHFLQPDYTAGGEYMARNTEYLIPSGFLRRARHDARAAALAAFMIEGCRKGMGILPHTLDDTYLLYNCYNWCEAALLYENAGVVESLRTALPVSSFIQPTAFFPKAGLFRSQQDGTFFACNVFKGGAFRFYTTKQGVAYDSGIEIVDQGTSLSTAILDYSNTLTRNGAKLTVRGRAKRIQEPVFSTSSMLAFKLYSITFGRFLLLQKRTRALLRKLLITYRRPERIEFERSFSFESGGIRVTDVLRNVPDGATLLAAAKASYLLVPSSKFASAFEVEHRRSPISEEHETTGNTRRIARYFPD
jgi:hypothetical protein